MSSTEMTFIDEKQAVEYFVEGLKKAASHAKQLAQHHQNPIWDDIALLLEEMRHNGQSLSNAKSMARNDVLNYIDLRSGKAGEMADAKAKSGLII